MPIHSQKILEERLKELLENFQLKTLSIELVRLLSRLKNHSLKIHILEHLLDLEEKFQNTPTEGFFFTKLNALASQIKALNSQIKMMETERSLKELKYTAYDFKTAAEKINFILEHLAA